MHGESEISETSTSSSAGTINSANLCSRVERSKSRAVLGSSTYTKAFTFSSNTGSQKLLRESISISLNFSTFDCSSTRPARAFTPAFSLRFFDASAPRLRSLCLDRALWELSIAARSQSQNSRLSDYTPHESQLSAPQSSSENRPIVNQQQPSAPRSSSENRPNVSQQQPSAPQSSSGNQPTVPRSTASRPTVPVPAVSTSAVSRPPVPRPAVSQPAVSKSAVPRPTGVQPSDVPQSSTLRSSSIQPSSRAIAPDTTLPGLNQDLVGRGGQFGVMVVVDDEIIHQWAYGSHAPVGIQALSQRMPTGTSVLSALPIGVSQSVGEFTGSTQGPAMNDRRLEVIITFNGRELHWWSSRGLIGTTWPLPPGPPPPPTQPTRASVLSHGPPSSASLGSPLSHLQ